MVVASGINQDEIASEDLGQRVRIMADDRQTAASLRTVRGERPDDDVSPWLDSPFDPIDVGGLIGWIDQKMERGPVVPQIVVLRRLPFRDVRDHPLDLAAALAETFPGCGKGGSGKIEDRESVELSGQQFVGEA